MKKFLDYIIKIDLMKRVLIIMKILILMKKVLFFLKMNQNLLILKIVLTNMLKEKLKLKILKIKKKI